MPLNHRPRLQTTKEKSKTFRLFTNLAYNNSYLTLSEGNTTSSVGYSFFSVSGLYSRLYDPSDSSPVLRQGEIPGLLNLGEGALGDLERFLRLHSLAKCPFPPHSKHSMFYGQSLET